MAITFTRDDFIKMLRSIYKRTVKEKKWSVALQSVALLGQMIGIGGKTLEKQGERRLPEVVPFSEMTDAQLIDFIEALKRLDPELEDEVQKNRAARNSLQNGIDGNYPPP